MSTAQIQLPPKLIPVFLGEAMYRGAYGGRGSAKSRSFAKMAAVQGMRCADANEAGVIVCGREFQNSLADSSFSEVKMAILSEPFLTDFYDIGDNYIRTKDKKIEFAFCGLRHNLDSIKSKSRIRLLYVDEAEPVSDKAWEKVIPTVREEGAEIWLTWNPERKKSATNMRFRLDPPKSSKIVELNWRDNPWFPENLNVKRLEDKEKRPDSYGHVWEGDYIQVQTGAYFARQITQARADHRIGLVPKDPLMTIRAFWDIGGTGAKADACAIWICQFVGLQCRVLDYYEAVGQELSVHVNWLFDNGYEKALIYLPHDGVNNDKVYNVSYESELRKAGFKVQVVPNQGAGAANQRVEAARRAFPFIYIDEEKCQGGLDAISWYHEKQDEQRGIGLGPCHDWSSHGADAFGMMAVVYEKESNKRAIVNDYKPKIINTKSTTGWMGR
jgi:phage terminase large subunit